MSNDNLDSSIDSKLNVQYLSSVAGSGDAAGSQGVDSVQTTSATGSNQPTVESLRVAEHFMSSDFRSSILRHDVPTRCSASHWNAGDCSAKLDHQLARRRSASDARRPSAPVTQ